MDSVVRGEHAERKCEQQVIVILCRAFDGNRQGLRLGGPYALHVALAIFLFVGSAAYSLVQLPRPAAPPPANVEATAPIDPLGRATPRGAVMGLLKCTESEDYETAARYLQPTPGQDTNLAQRVKELYALHGRFKGNIRTPDVAGEFCRSVKVE